VCVCVKEKKSKREREGMGGVTVIGELEKGKSKKGDTGDPRSLFNHYHSAVSWSPV